MCPSYGPVSVKLSGDPSCFEHRLPRWTKEPTRNERTIIDHSTMATDRPTEDDEP
jgi:hypothetical protein